MSPPFPRSPLTARIPSIQFKLTTLLALPLTVAAIWAWVTPQTGVHGARMRQQALRACNAAITGQRLAGHQLDGFRVIPSSVVQMTTKVTADYAVREGSLAGWNSGDVIRVRCHFQGGQAQLSQVASPQ